MYSLSVITCFVSVYCLYAIAEKTEIEYEGLTLRLRKSNILSKILTVLSFALTVGLLVHLQGTMTGTFAAINLWILLASLILLFRPFQKIKWVHLAVFTLVIMTLEMILIN